MACASALVCGACPGAASGADELASSTAEYGLVSSCGQGGTLPVRVEVVDAVAHALQREPELAIARANEAESKSDVTASKSAFLPSVQFVATNQRYVPSNPASPVIVIGNTVLGGAQTNSAYASFSLNWNVLNSGRDIAAYHGATAALRAASSALQAQLSDTLIHVLQAYADLYEAEIAAQSRARALSTLKTIESRAEERYRNGHGTTVAIGQARGAALDADRSFNQACREVTDKAVALGEAIGDSAGARQRFAVDEALPMPVLELPSDADLTRSIDTDPQVIAAKERVSAAQFKVREALRAFGPSVSLFARRDYLGESINSVSEANHRISPFDYQYGISFQQVILPLTSEASQVGKARAELRKAQAEYQKASLETEARARNALSARQEAEDSYAAARSGLREAEQVLTLSESLYQAGRVDLDDVQHAELDRDKAAADVKTLQSQSIVATWLIAREMRQQNFASFVLRQLHLVDQDEMQSEGR